VVAAGVVLGLLAVLRWEVAVVAVVAVAVVAVVAVRSRLLLVAGACGVAASVGWLTTVSPAAAAGVALALVLALVIAARPELVPGLLVVVVFLEGVQVGGLAVSFIVAPVALVFLLGELVRGRASRPRAPLVGVAVAYTVWASASALWTLNPGDTAFGLQTLGVALVYMLVFASLVRTDADLRMVLVAAAVGASLTGLVAIAQVAAGQDRAVGLQADPNYFAAFQILAVPLILALTSEARGAARIAAYAALLVTFGSILASLSRGGLLALLVVTLAALLVPSRLLFPSGGRRLAVGATLLVTGALLFTAVSDQLVPRLEGAVGGSETESAGAGRLNEWRAAWGSIQERPLLGLGYGGFVPESNDLLRATPGVDFTNFRLEEEGIEAHSAYISSAAELGIPGALLFVALLGTAGVSLVRVARTPSGSPTAPRVAAALSIGLVGWATTALFLSSEAARPLWITLGLSCALWAMAQGRARAPAPLGAPVPAPA